MSYHVSASHDKDGNVTSENDAFQSVKAGDSYDFSYNLQELSYMVTIHYGGNKGLGDISQEILSKGDMVLEFTDADGGTLLKLKLH